MSQNRLVREKSPYLLQHASNPVDWYPWGDEAFAKAKREEKPIFLSVGYSTCHWCHVMERESFEDRHVAELMNEIFVSIKVDREERPDVDSVYMKVSQMMTGRGGWPLTILMTPDKKPFFAGTYIPKRGRQQQLGMMELIPRVGELWAKSRVTMLESADKIIQVLQGNSSPSGKHRIGENTLHLAYRLLAHSFDTKHAGFGQAPKFPTPHTLLFLLRYWRRKGTPFALEMVEKTLRSMRQGGIFDHVGYGFHRYATDSGWQLPHFEKMLYDQALLAMAYTEAFQATKNLEYRQTAEEIFTYVLRDMTAPEGGFYAAEDADSEGEEGKYYTWTWEEIQDKLPAKDVHLLTSLFHLEENGNFSKEATGERQGRNVLFRTVTPEEFAARENIEKDEIERRMASLRKKLYALRQRKIRPLRDTKILTDWNGLMIAALAKAAQAFSRSDLAEAAGRASRFLLQRLRRSDGGLFHTHCDGQSKIEGFADDYAFLIWGLIDLYEATFEADHLQNALELNQYFLTHFWDEKRGGIHFTSSSGELLFIRQKESFDGAVPSSNSVAMQNFLRLGRITADAGLEDKAWQIGMNFAPDIAASPSAYTMMLCAADFALGPGYEIVISGSSDGKDTAAMLKSLREEFLPNKVVLFLPKVEKEARIRNLAPFTDSLRAVGGKATAYVCSQFACQEPTTDINIMLDSLGLST